MIRISGGPKLKRFLEVLLKNLLCLKINPGIFFVVQFLKMFTCVLVLKKAVGSVSIVLSPYLGKIYFRGSIQINLLATVLVLNLVGKA